MDHIGAAVLFAQAVVCRARIEKEKIVRRVGCLEQRVGRQIGDDDRYAPTGQRRHCGGRILGLLEPNLLKQELLVEEFAGRVVVLNREPRAGEAVILGGHVEQRDRGLAFRHTQVGDLDLERTRKRGRGRGEQHASGDQESDQGTSPANRYPANSL